MNVNVLSGNPSWVWYIAFSVPFMVFVLFCWILFKYVPVGAILRLAGRDQVVKFYRLRSGLRTRLDHTSNRNRPRPTQVEHSPAGQWRNRMISRLRPVGGVPIVKPRTTMFGLVAGHLIHPLYESTRHRCRRYRGTDKKG